MDAVLASRYRLQREIGRGGMATVYLAEDQKHRRPVAVKILHSHLAANVGSERFLREIEIAARLSHPHILTLIDSGETEGHLYYVMPFVEGESLRQRVAREKQLPLEDVLTIGRQVASALGYAHSRGVVHRDIKPENVMLHEGGAIVTDFGIAKAVSEAGSESLTQTGMAIGTPAYMSPEQASGEVNLDGRSDIYSLGCMLYEMIAGEPPFTGPNAQSIIMKRFGGPPPSLRRVRPGLPEATESAVLRALAQEPAERFPTAADFGHALEPGRANTPSAFSTTSMQVSGSDAKSIAVLPFADMSPQRDQEYFTDGIADEIITALSRIDALRVASRTSAFAFKGRNEDIGEIGRKLKVGTVLEGSVRKAGNRLRVSAQLVDVTNGYQLWSERYDRELEDVFAIQDEIAESIVKALRVVLSEGERRAVGRPRSGNIEAYEYYLRGRQFWHQTREKGVKFARRMFDRAIEIDPGYAAAYAALAMCNGLLYMLWDATEANIEGAQAASLKALALGPDLAEAHVARGFALTLKKDYTAAEQEFDTAIQLDPKNFEALLFYARACFQQGKMEEAARRFGEAHAARPEDYQALSLQALCFQALNRHEEAIETRRENFAVIERHLELNPDDARAVYFGANDLAALGDRARAIEFANRAVALDPDDSGVLYNVACVYANLGEAEKALDCLEQAVANGFGHREWIEHDSDLEPLHASPRYQALLNRM